jgi:hypothetical protein
MSRKTSFSRLVTGWSRMLCIVLAFLIPAQSATALALRTAGPAHTHRMVKAPATKPASSWKPANPVFRHKGAAAERPPGLPPGFEWAASLPGSSGSAHQGELDTDLPHVHAQEHTTERHHHGAADSSVLLDANSSALDSSTDSDNGAQGGAGLMAWAPPCASARWPRASESHPIAASIARWRDHLPAPQERPPRTA